MVFTDKWEESLLTRKRSYTIHTPLFNSQINFVSTELLSEFLVEVYMLFVYGDLPIL